jgi:rsbT co-antagonist protein RsbR
MKMNEELSSIIGKNSEQFTNQWLELIESNIPFVLEMIRKEDLNKRGMLISKSLASGLKEGIDLSHPSYSDLTSELKEHGKQLSIMNVTPSETAQSILIIKDIFIPFLSEVFSQDYKKFFEGSQMLNKVIDKMGLFTFENYVNTRESVIKEQAQTILEMSTPVVKVWSNIILLPLVGVLDSTRAKQMMESLLTSIEENQAKVAILDISGIPVIDTLVARHLFTTIAAVKLMGAECIVTGISAKISQTIVHLGLDLSGIITKSTFADGLQLALLKTKQTIV